MCLDIDDKPLIKFTDEEAQKIIEKISKCRNVSEFQALDIKLRDKYLKKFRESKICKQFICLIHKYNFESVAPDQDYLNVLCKDRIKYCDIGWNKTPFPADINPFDDSKLKLVHYKLNFKPWHYDGVRYEKFFWEYAKSTPFYKQLFEMKLRFTEAQAEKENKGFLALQETAKKYTQRQENYKTFIIE